MAYDRASWRSGLIYSQTCEKCQTKITYKEDNLGFRPWYPNGFVYCPTCRTPLRHNEMYAINRPEQTIEVDLTKKTRSSRAAFCSGCGRVFGEKDNFCPVCGTRR